jgi:hypothetical protein
MEEFYLAKVGRKSKKARIDPSIPFEHSKCEKTAIEDVSFGEIPIDSTFVIKDYMTSTAKNVLDEPMEIEKNFKTAKKLVRVKKGNGDGTPVTSKSGGDQESTNIAAKPKKKLMDITNIDSHDETFKIPMNPSSVSKVSLKSLNRTFSFDDVNISDNWESNDISGYPKWCLHLKRSCDKQYYTEREGKNQTFNRTLMKKLFFTVVDVLFISYPIVIKNPSEIFPHSNEDSLVRSRSSVWEDTTKVAKH